MSLLNNWIKNANIELYEKLINQKPLHASPMEHCARAMTDKEYDTYIKGKVPSRIGITDFQSGLSRQTRKESIEITKQVGGWCRNFKGFIQYREILENVN